MLDCLTKTSELGWSKGLTNITIVEHHGVQRHEGALDLAQHVINTFVVAQDLLLQLVEGRFFAAMVLSMTLNCSVMDTTIARILAMSSAT